MAKQDLPREVTRLPLDYGRLVSTLDTVEGESVIVRLSPREHDNESTAGIASIVGEIRHETRARYTGHEFSIGTPWAERVPEYLAGGILFIRKETFESATLSTFDGNALVQISSPLMTKAGVCHPGDDRPEDRRAAHGFGGHVLRRPSRRA